MSLIVNLAVRPLDLHSSHVPIGQIVGHMSEGEVLVGLLMSFFDRVGVHNEYLLAFDDHANHVGVGTVDTWNLPTISHLEPPPLLALGDEEEITKPSRMTRGSQIVRIGPGNTEERQVPWQGVERRPRQANTRHSPDWLAELVTDFTRHNLKEYYEKDLASQEYGAS